MNEELQTALTSVIANIMAVGEKAYQFGEDQLPSVIEELMVFNAAKYVVLAIVYLVPLFAIYKWWRYALAQKASSPNFYWDRDKDPEVGFLPLFTASAIGMLPLLLLVSTVLNLLKITLAPRVWLLEYAAAMIK